MKHLVACLWALWIGIVHGGCLDVPLKGVNLAGAEFAAQKLPGVLGTDYVYPTRVDLVFFRAAGMNTIRLPFRWERVQHVLLGPLDAAELMQIGRMIGWASELGLCIVLDMHNYGVFGSQKIGGDEVSPAAFEDVWQRLLTIFPDANTTAAGLMNEPAALKATQWISVAQSTVLALRRAGAKHLLLVGSGRWSGAHEWGKRFEGSSAADAFEHFTDPLNRYAIEVHQYFDSNFSGTSVECIAPHSLHQTMQLLARWSQEHKVRFFMGEFGASGTTACLTDLRTLLEPMQESRVWLGWTYWAAGALWGSYPFSIHPSKGTETPQLTLLREFLPTP
jgi:endoglucanase